MANTQPLSPQGYNIQDAPMNTNPFWGDDENTDPSVYQRLTALEEDVTEIEGTMATETDLENYYNKDEIDERFNSIPSFDPDDYVSNSELTQALNDFKDAEDASIADSYYNKTQVDNQLSTKANISAFNNYYNKTEIDAKQADDDARLDALEGNDRDQDLAIQDLQNTVDNLSDTVDGLADDVTACNDTVTDMSSTVGDLSDDVVEIQLDITQLQGSVLGIDNRLGDAETDIVNIKLDIDQLQGSVLSIQDTIGDINSVLEVVLNGNNS